VITHFDETSGAALPCALPARMLIAIPSDGSPPIALATLDRCQFFAHLERAGFDPDHCAIGTADFTGADFMISWARTVHLDAAR
jgi:hypothetical protein